MTEILLKLKCTMIYIIYNTNIKFYIKYLIFTKITTIKNYLMKKYIKSN